MKKVMLLIWCLLFFHFISISFGQVNSGFQISNEDYGNFSSNNAEHPCISEEQYLMIEQSCKENIQLLQSKGVLHKNSAAVTLFNWPLKAANGLSDCSFYRISAYVELIFLFGHLIFIKWIMILLKSLQLHPEL